MMVCVRSIEQLVFAALWFQILAAQPLGGELNRRQRILDLVREPPRHFAPCGIALRLQERRDVVEHDRVAVRAVGIAGQLRARADQHAPAAFRAQHDLLAPLAVAVLQARARDADELPEQRLGFGELDDGLAYVSFEVYAENRARSMVGRPDPEVGLEGDDARRQARKDHLELAALALDLLLTLPRVLARAREPLRHVVERVHEKADLVARRRRHARRKVAARHGARALHQQLDRRNEAAREIERPIDGREQRDQQHEAQRQREARLQRRA